MRRGSALIAARAQWLPYRALPLTHTCAFPTPAQLACARAAVRFADSPLRELSTSSDAPSSGAQPARAPKDRRPSSPRVVPPPPSPLLEELLRCPPSAVRKQAQTVWARGKEEAHPWTAYEVLLVLRRLNDAAGRIRDREAENHMWMQRLSGVASRHELTPLTEFGVDFMSLLSDGSILWNLSDRCVRELLILLVRCRHYQQAANLYAWVTYVTAAKVTTVRRESGETVDDHLVHALLEMHAHAEPQRGTETLDGIINARTCRSRIMKMMASAPGDAPTAMAAAAVLVQQVLSAQQRQLTYRMTADALCHLSMLFSHQLQRSLYLPLRGDGPGVDRATISAASALTAADIAARYVRVPRGYPFGVERLHFDPDHTHRLSAAQQALLLLEAFERQVHVYSRRSQWARVERVAELYLSALAERAKHAKVPSMRTDLLHAVLYATALARPDNLSTIFNQLLTVFRDQQRASLGLDVHAWVLYLRTITLQPFSREAADVAVIYEQAMASTPRESHMLIINAYLDYLCAPSVETLESRWKRVHAVLHALCEREAQAESGSSESENDRGEPPTVPLLEPDLMLYASVTRMLDHLHREQVPFQLPASPLASSSAFRPLATLLSPDLTSSPSQPALSCEYLADELHAHAQTQRGAHFLHFNPSTNNVMLPLGSMHEASDAWVRAVCYLTCRALKRAVEMQSDLAIPNSQPLTLVLESDAVPLPAPSREDAPVLSVREGEERFQRRWTLPVAWLHHVRTAVATASSGVTEAAESKHPLPQRHETSTSRVMAALQHVFDELAWKQQDATSIPRVAAATSSTAPPGTPLADTPLREHVFTFDVAEASGRQEQ